MGRLDSWRAAARHSPRLWGLVGIVVVALVASGIVYVTTRSTPTRPSSPPSTRAVALGDSVPYGHGLANPYLTPQVGLPTTAVSEGPSALAYPTAVAKAIGLTMAVRPTNCNLVGDQLAISGAVADADDNTGRDGQCPHPPQQARNLSDEIAAAQLDRHPARLVLLQDGADDIHFSACLEYQLARVANVNIGLGTACTADGDVTPQLAVELARVRSSLAQAIEAVAPHTKTVAVLDYYQPIPSPNEIADHTGLSNLHTNLVCAGLKSNAASTDAAAQLVLAALNESIAAAVSDARAHHVTNVTLVDIAHATDGHGVCTADPWVYSGEPVPDATLAADTEHILAAKACTGTDVLHGPSVCSSLAAAANNAESNLQGYVWRAAHPNAAGQRAIAADVVARLKASATSSKSAP
ncbi:MAG TPA: hypothetical protein VHD39_00685 [Acidimicrobiales bacterium]|nr:hypothetical protein [Acidimicrobiales bacterium]